MSTPNTPLTPQSVMDVLNPPTLENQPTVIPPVPPKAPVFDSEQQEYIDHTLIPKVMGRAAADVRRQLADSKTRLATAEAALRAQSPDSSQVERLEASLQLSKAELEATKAAATEATRT